ncbi:Rpp14/Pop5 family protein [Ignicoccus hospitalis]|uniref:Ribonuclease P protein component 2 n=1 Tax=Ignicoccus hospitalis (strain KIN4/I / DSM 18386 / JCM 14125) TaxID=453591 RepID=A8ACE9_IGNH4|nr:Rpp14/Pop5 family protein [Ignicoccus hospitalis]ABU82601.1 Ribonuclease P-related [Ignicoccus hospitalis KIN4/I]HIH90766.1 hypothetical protein [Desulfurococcaceae archaeon]
MICEVLAAAALVTALVALYKANDVEIEVIEKKLAKKRAKKIRRYVLVLVLSERPEEVEEGCVEGAVIESLKRAYGTIGLALTDPKLAYFDPDLKVAIFRTTLEGVKLLSSSLLYVEEACGTKVNLISLRAFGTLASAREKLPKLGKYVKNL